MSNPLTNASPLTPGPQLSDYLKGVPGGADLAQTEAKTEADQQVADKSYKEGAQKIESIQKYADSVPVPTFTPQPQPKEKTADPLAAFGSTASWLAIFGGLMTRHALTNGLNAAAGAMTAIHANDLATYKQQYDEWKVATENAQKMFQFQNDIYKDVQDRAGNDIKSVQAGMEANAHALKDDPMLAAIKERGMDGAIQLMEARDRMSLSLAEHQAALDKEHEKATLLLRVADARKQISAAKTPDEKAAAQQKLQEAQTAVKDWASVNVPGVQAVDARAVGNSTMKPETLDRLADQLIAGDKSALQGVGTGQIGAANKAALQDVVTQKMADAGMTGADIAKANAEFFGQAAGERTLGTRTANVEMAVNEAANMADMVTQTSREVPRTSFIPANKAILSYEKNTGDPKVVAFGAALNSFVNAYARAISPSGTPTDSDKSHAREVLDTAQSQEQIDAAIKQLKAEMEAARKAPGQVRQEFRDGAASGSQSQSAGPGGHFVGEVVTSPDGVKHKITGFDKDGTPMGEALP